MVKIIFFHLVYDAGETYTFMRETWIQFFQGHIGIEEVCAKYDQEGRVFSKIAQNFDHPSF